MVKFLDQTHKALYIIYKSRISDEYKIYSTTGLSLFVDTLHTLFFKQFSSNDLCLHLIIYVYFCAISISLSLLSKRNN